MNQAEQRGPEEDEDEDSKGKKFEDDIDDLYNPKK